MSSPVAQRHADRAIPAPVSSRTFKARTHARFFPTSPTRNENRTLLEYRTGATANQHPPRLCIDSPNRLTPTNFSRHFRVARVTSGSSFTPFGNSPAMSWSGGDPGYGVAVHLPRNWAIGVTRNRDDDLRT